MFFKIKQKIWKNVPQEAAFNCVALQNFTKFYSFRMCDMLLNSGHKLKCETNLTLLSTQSHIYLPQWRYFGAPFWELSLNFIMHRCVSYLSIWKSWQSQFSQHLQNEKHLATYVRFCCWLVVAVKWFQIIYCRIGWQLTSGECWNTELKSSMSESNIWKILIFYCRQGKGKSLMKTLRLRIIVIELSQYMSSQINI